MNCLRCNTENEEGAKFCKNCGMDMTYTPSNDNTNSNQTVNQLLLLMGIQYFIYLCWFILQTAIVPIFFKKDDIVDWGKVSSIYKYFDWTTDILSVIALLIFAIIVKNKNARIFLIIFLVMSIVFLIGYKVF
jgi:uncharacterized membrane protein YvbJ